MSRIITFVLFIAILLSINRTFPQKFRRLSSHVAFQISSSRHQVSSGSVPLRSRLYTTSKIDGIHIPDDSALQQLILKFNCDELDSDTLSEVLLELGCLSVSCEVNSERSRFVEERKWNELVETKNWQTAILRAHFPSSFNIAGAWELVKLSFPAVADTGGLVQLSEPLQVKDWVRHVQSSWPPLVVGDLTIQLPWHEVEVIEMQQSEGSNSTSDNKQHGKKITLEGGAAFGTGDHPTTRLCINWLQHVLKTHQLESQSKFQKVVSDQPRISVLDYGCGSAILGIVSLVYGATSASGVDIDLDSLLSARNNCARNNVNMDLYLSNEHSQESAEERSVSWNTLRGEANHSSDLLNVEINSNTHSSIRVDTGSEENIEIAGVAENNVGAFFKSDRRAKNEFLQLSSLQKNSFNVTVANILAPVLIQMSESLAGYVVEGGKICLSGILSGQAEKVIKSYSPYFDNTHVAEEEDGWVLITGVRKGSNHA